MIVRIRTWFAPRTINGLHPVLGSRHEPSTVCILFLVRATNHQRFASCSWFASRTINGLHPVLGSRHEPSTVCILFLVRATNHQQMAFRQSARLDRGLNKPSPFAEYGKSRVKMRTTSAAFSVRSRSSEARRAGAYLYYSRQATLATVHRISRTLLKPTASLSEKKRSVLRSAAMDGRRKPGSSCPTEFMRPSPQDSILEPFGVRDRA
jgi:hypothetical protein